MNRFRAYQTTDQSGFSVEEEIEALRVEVSLKRNIWSGSSREWGSRTTRAERLLCTRSGHSHEVRF
jgi:hypothetical protein